MLVLPAVTRLQVQHYGLFPGDPPGVGIDRPIASGVTLIAGINGLGKTTLLNVILRLLTGPYDLTSMGVGQLGSTLSDKPTKLNAQALRFFGQRVADQAEDATATLEASFGARNIVVERRLQTLRLVRAEVDGQSILRPGLTGDAAEGAYQKAMRRLMGLSSFVDVLLILHFTVFFPEERPSALWDTNAQRHLLRAIFLPGPTAAAIAEAERQLASADSYARNVSAVLFRQKQDLNKARAAQAAAPGVRARVSSQQALLDATLTRRSSLDERREVLEAELESARLDYERAKNGREDAERAVERLKYGSISRMFPKLPDTVRLTVLALLSKGECLVCGAHAEAARAAIEAELRSGMCPVCHSPPEDQQNVVSVRQVETSRLARTRKRAMLAAQEEAAQSAKVAQLEDENSELLAALKEISTEVSNLQRSVRGLSSLLPTPSVEINLLQSQVEGLEKSLRDANGRRAEHAEALRIAFAPVQEAAIAKTEALVKAFQRYAVAFLADEATLVRDTARPAIAQQNVQSVVPAFYAEMGAAARPGMTRRRSTFDVSESQRELMDLAFRFALIEAAGCDGAATLIMETPEASLDELAMERVGQALNAFARQGTNRLVATSNLTNAGMISWLFGGRAANKSEVDTRRNRTIDLLKVSAKNRPLLNDTAGRYPNLLAKALTG